MGRKKEFTGIWIPREIWEDDRLSIHDKVAFAVISGLARGEAGCFATNKALAEFCKTSERQICRTVGNLIRFGYLRTENAGSPVRRLYLADRPTDRPTDRQEERQIGGEERQVGEVKNARLAGIERQVGAVTTPDWRGKDENLPIIYNYNNIYNNNYNNKAENKPTMEEIKGYISERKAKVDPVKFYEYYDAGNWLDRKGNPINWRQKVLLWDSDADRKKDDTDAAPAASSFDTDDFFAASLEASGQNDTADDDLPWVGG